MGYPKVKDFETGPIAGYWEEAIGRGSAGFEFEVEDGRKAADRIRYQINAFRARAVEDGYYLGQEMQEFVVKIVELQGRVFIKFEKVFNSPKGLPRFLTAKEKKEQATVEERVKALAERLATKQPVEVPPSVELTDRAKAYGFGPKATAEGYVPRSAAAVAALAQGAPEHILRALDRAEDLRVQGVLTNK
jgi:hypothetical protein